MSMHDGSSPALAKCYNKVDSFSSVYCPHTDVDSFFTKCSVKNL